VPYDRRRSEEHSESRRYASECGRAIDVFLDDARQISDEIGQLPSRIHETLERLNFFVADYRGYGKSGGTPSFTNMLADANTVLEAMRIVLGASGYQGPVYVMGRSMGRHSAFELAAKEDPAINGVIIESGRPSLGQFTGGLGPQQADDLEEAYRAKAASIAIPVLVIHGEMDALAPLDDAEEMFRNFASTGKKMLVIPGAGHNDLLFKGLDEYFTAIGDFIFG